MSCLCSFEGKNQRINCNLFLEIIFSMEYKWMPQTITGDLQQGIIRAINPEFSDSSISGCSLNFKEAIPRKLMSIKTPEKLYYLCNQGYNRILRHKFFI
ncbi:hypothetical protein HZS_75 [Henneguya salminicola]|nr:hypothetical protein HZS_75 [Henneguya salminicola]